jgi:hypothetical protein
MIDISLYGKAIRNTLNKGCVVRDNIPMIRLDDGNLRVLTEEENKLVLPELERLQIELQIQVQQTAFNNAIQTHLDTKAKEFRYDNMMSARSYAGYDNPFQAEAQRLAVWASNCWVKAGEIEADVQAGNREMPTIDEVLSELPIYE